MSNTYRVQILRVAGKAELEVTNCSSTEEAVKRAIDGLLANPEAARALFDQAQATPTGGKVVEFMERDVRVVT